MKYEKKLAIRMGTAILLMALPILSVNIIDIILQKPTMYISYAIMKIIGYDLIVRGNVIIMDGNSLKFVAACTATSAYYLLAMLILLTKDIKLKKVLQMFALGSLMILVMNVIRIDILLVVLAEKGIRAFQSLHLLFWEVVSSLYVAAVWVYLTKRFKVKEIPVFSDIKYLYKKSRKKRR